MADPGRSAIRLPPDRDHRRRRHHPAHAAPTSRHRGPPGGPVALQGPRRLRRPGGDGGRARGLRRSMVAMDRSFGRGERIPPRRRGGLDRRHARVRRPDRSRLAVNLAVLRVGGAGGHRTCLVRRVERALGRPHPGPTRRHSGRNHCGVGVHADARSGMVRPGAARRARRHGESGCQRDRRGGLDGIGHCRDRAPYVRAPRRPGLSA